jgi:hypothetical protein
MFEQGPDIYDVLGSSSILGLSDGVFREIGKKRPGPKARQGYREASRLEDVGSEDPFPDIASGTHIQLFKLLK